MGSLVSCLNVSPPRLACSTSSGSIGLNFQNWGNFISDPGQSGRCFWLHKDASRKSKPGMEKWKTENASIFPTPPAVAELPTNSPLQERSNGIKRSGKASQWLSEFVKGRIQMKSVKLHVLVIGCILVGVCSPTWAQATEIEPGQTLNGTIGAAAQTNSYTFSASAGDIVMFTVTATSGNLSPELQLLFGGIPVIPPVYPFSCSGATIGVPPVTLTQTGTYTVDVGDCSSTYTGNYD